MWMNKKSCFQMILTFYLIMGSGPIQQSMGVRILDGENWMVSGLVFNALPKGSPVRSSKSSPCTYIPNKVRGRCAMEIHNQDDDVAHVAVAVDHYSFALPTFPDLVGKFGVALGKIITNQTQRKLNQGS